MVENNWRLWYKHSNWSFDPNWLVQRKSLLGWETIGKFESAERAKRAMDTLIDDEKRRKTKPEKSIPPKKEGWFERMRKMKNDEDKTDR